MTASPRKPDPRPGEVMFVEETDRGTISIRNRCPPEFLQDVVLDEGLGTFSHYSSIIRETGAFTDVAMSRDGRVTLALLNDKTVIGYGVSWHPGPDDRWSALGDLMYEMGALEISRNYRSLGLAKKIFDAVMDDDFFEDKIAYMNGFSWHWDLDGTGLTMLEYRSMMIGFLRDHQFQECYTNEPNVCLREANFFMVRIGSRVSEEDRNRFRNLRFGIKPH